MSTSTFLGTPLTKYEIDDIETDLVHKKARELEKERGLQYRQNRERIKRNRMNTLYTVDTKEGFVPSNFKSSKANRASYSQQNVSIFTDLEDSDIISKNTLRAIKIDRAGLQRNIASIVNALGFMGKRRFIGPVNVNAVETRISHSLEGVGYTFDVDKGVERVKFVKAEHDDNEMVAHKKGDTEGAKGATASTVSTPTRHVNDRQYDLSEIQLYYKHLYSVIVKSIDVKEDLVEKIAKGIDFTKERPSTEKQVETGRKVEQYTFDDELLRMFKIRTKRHESEDIATIGNQKDGNEISSGPKLPC